MTMIKVYNKGTRPIIYKRDWKGVDAIHPRKFRVFEESAGKAIIEKFKDACAESEFLALKEEGKKAAVGQTSSMKNDYKASAKK